MSKRKNEGIIDFRVRPPLIPFKILFDLKLRRLTWENKFNILPSCATAPSMYRVGEQEGLSLPKKRLTRPVSNMWSLRAETYHPGPKPSIQRARKA